MQHSWLLNNPGGLTQLGRELRRDSNYNRRWFTEACWLATGRWHPTATVLAQPQPPSHTKE
jgi:hypothetical protein